MSELETSNAKQVTPGTSYLLWRRLHSLTGIVPIGAFMLFHFFENASARRSPEAFNETVEKISSMPYLYAIEIFGLIVPILFHAIFGLYITASAKPNLVRHTNARNISYFLQRITGMIAVFYIGYHVWTTRVWALFTKGGDITYADMAEKLSHPTAFWIYVIGIISITFHFANGLWSFSVTWGIVRTRGAQQKLAWLTIPIFLTLCIVGLDILSAFVYQKPFLSCIGL